jgi:predicted transposase/invertase (TIGR01784 family)
MRPVFADPKTDFVFKRIFGSEAHKQLLIELLNALLELAGENRIVDLDYLPPEQHVPVEELKLSVVDVKCQDANGRFFVVEMQILNVEGFEKRIVYNAAKAYVMQLRSGEDYPVLADIVGVTICDFNVWPDGPLEKHVPMLSHWRMQEQHGGALGLSQIQHVFLELPKYAAGGAPQTLVERWAFFFRETKNLHLIPPVLAEAPWSDALEVARIARFDEFELDAYDRAKMAEQDARGALSLALRQGREEGEKKGHAKGLVRGRAEGRAEGLAEGRRSAIRTLCAVFAIELDEARQTQLVQMSVEELESLQTSIVDCRAWPGSFS